MHFKLATALIAFAASATAHYIPSHKLSTRKNSIRRCGDGEPSARQLNQSLALSHVETAKLSSNSRAFDFDVEVNVHVHVISASKSTFISKKQVEAQVAYLNKAFNPYDVYFKHKSTDFLVHSNWSGGDGDFAMKKRLRKGAYKDLNLYYVDVAKLEGEEVLGHCAFPEPDVAAGSDEVIHDGCVMDAQTVPGGTFEPYNLGATTVHEVGHWFNLFHTFDGGCEEGDEVWDTPASASASFGCPIMRDSCPDRPGIDPIHNFMDYSDDSCLESFSLGQRRRMHSSWQSYRLE